jgi:superfamily I DNA and/or RNA helicase
MHTTYRTLDELLECTDAWSLSESERKVLYEYVQEEVRRMQKSRLRELMDQHVEKHKFLRELEDAKDLHVMRENSVVGMTTTGAAKLRGLVQALAPRIVLVEEAAEVLEAHVLASLSSMTQHLILIGDHKQLRYVCVCVRARARLYMYVHVCMDGWMDVYVCMFKHTRTTHTHTHTHTKNTDRRRFRPSTTT